jgi:hypothetical protein
MPVEAPYVQKPQRSTVMLAMREDLRLVKIPIEEGYNQAGRSVQTFPGQAVAFEEGKLRVPPSGEMQLEDGRKAPAKEILEWLEDHKLFGDRHEGFWRLEEPAPQPSEEELNALLELTVDGDIPGLERFIAEEQDGFKRKQLIQNAEQSLERVRSKLNAEKDTEPKPTRKAT